MAEPTNPEVVGTVSFEGSNFVVYMFHGSVDGVALRTFSIYVFRSR